MVAENGYNEEENKVVEETRKMFHLPSLPIAPTCIRVPVLRAHSEALNIEFESDPSVDDIYATCAKLKAAGVTINRPPRDGHMAFIRTPDNISIELLQKGGSLPAAEPWASMANTGVW